jgi:uncharacterized protein
VAQGTALITGASAGIGAVYAERLARRGYDLILVARGEERLKAISRRLSLDTRRSITVMVADLTNTVDLDRVEQVLTTDASICVLVNNAGAAMSGEVAAADLDRLESMIRLNVVAPTRLAAAVIPRFVARRRGTLINISSTVAFAPDRMNGIYSGTQAYLLNLSVKLHQELAGEGIRVQVVLPGAIRTALWAKAGTDTGAFGERALMDPGDMVDAALAGLDRGESVTIPSLPDRTAWNTFEAARRTFMSRLSRTK